MQELETSFAVREAPAPPPPRPVACRAGSDARQSDAARRRVLQLAPVRPVIADPDPDELLRSIEEQLGQFERRQAGRFACGACQRHALNRKRRRRPAPDWDAPVEEQPAPVFGRAERRVAGVASRIRPFAESAEAAEVAPEPEESASRLSAAAVRLPLPRSCERQLGSAAAARRGCGRGGAAKRSKRLNLHRKPASTPTIFSRRPTLKLRSPMRKRLSRAGVPRENVLAKSNGASGSPRRFRSSRRSLTPTRTQPDLAGLEAGLSRELEPQYSDAASGRWISGWRCACGGIASGCSDRAWTKPARRGSARR